MTYKTLQEAAEAIKELMIADYARFNKHSDSDIGKRFIEEYRNSFRIENGRKYIKLVANQSVKGFIVKEPVKQFQVGDMLMAASWKTPALNFARGNALKGEFDRVRWTGIR